MEQELKIDVSFLQNSDKCKELLREGYPYLFFYNDEQECQERKNFWILFFLYVLKKYNSRVGYILHMICMQYFVKMLILFYIWNAKISMYTCTWYEI